MTAKKTNRKKKDKISHGSFCLVTWLIHANPLLISQEKTRYAPFVRLWFFFHCLDNHVTSGKMWRDLVACVDI